MNSGFHGNHALFDNIVTVSPTADTEDSGSLPIATLVPDPIAMSKALGTAVSIWKSNIKSSKGNVWRGCFNDHQTHSMFVSALASSIGHSTHYKATGNSLSCGPDASTTTDPVAKKLAVYVDGWKGPLYIDFTARLSDSDMDAVVSELRKVSHLAKDRVELFTGWPEQTPWSLAKRTDAQVSFGNPVIMLTQGDRCSLVAE